MLSSRTGRTSPVNRKELHPEPAAVETEVMTEVLGSHLSFMTCSTEGLWIHDQHCSGTFHIRTMEEV
jgi:hypothetical protein